MHFYQISFSNTDGTFAVFQERLCRVCNIFLQALMKYFQLIKNLSFVYFNNRILLI